jgi:hypothetical protein
MWTGEIIWFDRDGSGLSPTVKITGSLRDDKVVFEYYDSWNDMKCLAEFDTRNGHGTARCATIPSSPPHATFTGQSKKQSEDQIEMWGGVWLEKGKEYGWKADLGDY